MANLALFDINLDGGDQGYDAEAGAELSFTLRLQPPHGIRTWELQVFDAARFDRANSIAVNPPRKSPGAPDLTLVGATSGPAVSPTTLAGSITTTLPGESSYIAWILRSVVDDGRDGNGRLDPNRFHERMVVVRDDDGARPIIATEDTQYSDDG